LNDHFLDQKLNDRHMQDAFRRLLLPEGKIDFCSNDYLGIVTNRLIEAANSPTSAATLAPRPIPTPTPAPELTAPHAPPPPQAPALAHGSGGSRLLAGNYPLIEETEKAIASFHQAETGLLFNSGYDANLGVLSCIPQRGDSVFYDSLSHASIRDGIRLSFAQSYSFAHNDCADLEKKLQLARAAAASTHTAAAPTHTAAAPTRAAAAPPPNLFVVTESLFSMDGDLAPLEAILSLCRQYGAHLIVDEAHATGVVGPRGEGLVQAKGLQQECLARIHTFGKAVGCHGAIVLGSHRLRDYLINFCRAFIYTTALPPASVHAIATAYDLFPRMNDERKHLQRLIDHFQTAAIGYERLNSITPIQVIVVPGNTKVRALAGRLQAAGLDIRPILYPTVPKGAERLRVVIHAFNNMEEIGRLINILQ
jgi:8-amino-7-oxononanoate synthase